MKRLGNAVLIATILTISVSCTRRPTSDPKPYAVQRDVLGESLNAFVLNNPGCKPVQGAIDRSQFCAVTERSTYAGMPVMGRVARFYEGRLYSLMLSAPTNDCRRFDLLGALREKFGEPKKTEIVRGKEVTPYHVPGSDDFKIWQNGVSTITFQESMGSLDACTTDFGLDSISLKVSDMEVNKKAEEDKLKRKDM